MQYYRIYGKDKKDKAFKPFDYHGGAFVKNLIYATMIKENQLQGAQKMVNYMNANNPQFIFELRAV
jgi:hypothetical protein